MEDTVWIALISAVPATIAAIAALKAARRVKTSNGHTAGQLSEAIHEDVKILKLWMIEHQRDHERDV